MDLSAHDEKGCFEWPLWTLPSYSTQCLEVRVPAQESASAMVGRSGVATVQSAELCL